MAIALAASSKLVHARLRAQASQRAHRDVAERHLLGSLAVRAAHPGMLSAELALADCLLLCTCWRSTQLVERPPPPPCAPAHVLWTRQLLRRAFCDMQLEDCTRVALQAAWVYRVAHSNIGS